MTNLLKAIAKLRVRLDSTIIAFQVNNSLIGQYFEHYLG